MIRIECRFFPEITGISCIIFYQFFPVIKDLVRMFFESSSVVSLTTSTGLRMNYVSVFVQSLCFLF